jgi:hypothetical protein
MVLYWAVFFNVGDKGLWSKSLEVLVSIGLQITLANG